VEGKCLDLRLYYVLSVSNDSLCLVLVDRFVCFYLTFRHISHLLHSNYKKIMESASYFEPARRNKNTGRIAVKLIVRRYVAIVHIISPIDVFINVKCRNSNSDCQHRSCNPPCNCGLRYHNEATIADRRKMLLTTVRLDPNVRSSCGCNY
jgi:hypothetical protein